MFNVGSAELLVILLVALIVLGPSKLPDAARQVGKFMGEVRRMSSGFQDELRDAMQEPVDSLKGTIKGDPVPKATPAAAVKPVSQVIDQAMPGERIDQAMPDERIDQAMPGERIDQAMPGERIDQAVPGERIDQAVPGERIDQTVPGERNDGAVPAAHTVPSATGADADPAVPDEAAAADPSSTSLGGPTAAVSSVEEHAGDDDEAVSAVVRTAPSPTPAD